MKIGARFKSDNKKSKFIKRYKGQEICGKTWAPASLEDTTYRRIRNNFGSKIILIPLKLLCSRFGRENKANTYKLWNVRMRYTHFLKEYPRLASRSIYSLNSKNPSDTGIDFIFSIKKSGRFNQTRVATKITFIAYNKNANR